MIRIPLRTWMDERSYSALQEKRVALKNRLPADCSLSSFVSHRTTGEMRIKVGLWSERQLRSGNGGYWVGGT